MLKHMGNANGNMEMLKSNGEELRNDYESHLE